MRTIVNHSVLPTAALILAASLSHHASAEQLEELAVSESAVEIQTVSIAYARAELGTEAGRASLYRKIRHAARAVCGPAGLRETGSLTISSRNRECYKYAVAAAVSQVGSGQLAAAGR